MHRHDRPHPAFQRIDRDPPQVFGPLDEIGMREFLEGDEEIRRRDPLRGQMAMRIEAGAQQHIGADDLADTAQKIALGVQISLRDHGAVQAQHHGIERQRRAQLIQNLVTQRFVGTTRDQAGGVGPGGGALDQCPALVGADPAPDRDRRGAQRRRGRMLAGRGVKRALESLPVDNDGRKRVRLGRQRRDEDPPHHHAAL